MTRRRGKKGIGSWEMRRRFGGGNPILPRFFLLLLVVLILPSCEEAANRGELAERIAATEGDGSTDARVAELRADIRSVQNEAEKVIQSVRDEGTFWRLLGLKYMDMQMWGEALEAFEEASEIYPAYPAILYYRGLSAANLALSADRPSERSALLARAEASYRRSIETDTRYTNPYYALAILLVFELDRPLEAGPILDEYLRIERSDTRARFLRARVYLEAGRPELAIRLYDEIIDISTDKEEKNRAAELRDRVAGGGTRG